MEESQERAILQTLLQNKIHTCEFWIDLPQWKRLGEKKTIAKVLQITHSQWIYCNISLHDKTRGYLRRPDIKEMTVKIDMLLDIKPDEIPMDSQSLLEFNHRKLVQSNIHDKTY